MQCHIINWHKIKILITFLYIYKIIFLLSLINKGFQFSYIPHWILLGWICHQLITFALLFCFSRKTSFEKIYTKQRFFFINFQWNKNSNMVYALKVMCADVNKALHPILKKSFKENFLFPSSFFSLSVNDFRCAYHVNK